MEVKACKKCGRLFQYITGRQICVYCKKAEEELFVRVKTYLRENPGATISEVSVATETTPTVIEGFLKQGRLEVAPGSPISLACEKCGEKIYTGRYCKVCQSKLENVLRGTMQDMDKERAIERATGAVGKQESKRLRFKENR